MTWLTCCHFPSKWIDGKSGGEPKKSATGLADTLADAGVLGSFSHYFPSEMGIDANGTAPLDAGESADKFDELLRDSALRRSDQIWK